MKRIVLNHRAVAPGLVLTSLLLASHGMGATVVVSNTTDLINAVNSNAAGNPTTIVMNAGTYNLTSTTHASSDPNICIDILNPLTLTSAEGAAVTINCAVDYSIRVLTPNVTLSNFTLNGQKFGIQVQDTLSRYGGTISGIIIRGVTAGAPVNGGQVISGGGLIDSIIEKCTITSGYNSGIVLDVGPTGAGSNRNLIINNSVTSTTTGAGIAVRLSDYNTVAGNNTANTSFYGVLVIGGQHNYVSQNTTDNGVAFIKETTRQANRNLAVNNSIVMRTQTGFDGLWFNYDANYNFAFLNDASIAGEVGMALFNSAGNYVRANNFHNNAFGGIDVRKDPASGPTTPNLNSIQQNYFHNNTNNSGIIADSDNANDYGFNYVSGNPDGITTSVSTNSTFYSNIIRDTSSAEVVKDSSTGARFFLNRHFNASTHYIYTNSNAAFDSGSTTLGGNYYSDFTSANGNPSNGATPYTNIYDQNNVTGVNRDNYPYASENLGKSYNINLRIPSAGSYVATGVAKTIAWSSQGCVVVDLYLADTNGTPLSTIASNAPDFGYYRWIVPSVAQGQYRIREDCKNSANSYIGKTSVGPIFNITTGDLILLTPQANLMQDAGTPMQISWRKSSAIAAVDVYIRYSDSQAFTLLQAGVTADFYTITAPAVSSNRVSVRLGYGGSGDSTDGWFTIRGSSTGTFTSPSSAANLFVGTPTLVEWVSPQTTDYITLDLVGASTRNIVTTLGDFSSYLMLVPDMQGGGNSLRLTFYNAAGNVLQQISSPQQTILNSATQPDSLSIVAGNNQTAAMNAAFATPLQIQVNNASSVGIPNVIVTFTAPASGAGGSFGGSATATAVTNGSGVATAPAFTANGVTGSYTVTATIGGLTANFTLTNSAGALSTKTNIGFYYNSTFALDSNGNGSFDGNDKYFFYVNQQAGDIAVYGDWNGDGHTKVGIYRNGFWILDYNGNGVYDPANGDKFYGFGGGGTSYIPVVGDWNHDGRTKIGYYRGGFWALDYNGNGTFDGVGAGQDRFIALGGNANEFPIVGDWNHDGRTKVGVFFNGNFALDYDGDGQFTAADKFYSYVTYNAGDRPIVGDWNADGFTKIGIYRAGYWILDYNGNGAYDPASGDKFYGFGGNAGETPLVGDWNGDGRSKIGYYKGGFWALDYNGNGTFDGVGAGQDRFLAFGGNPGEQPIIGKW